VAKQVGSIKTPQESIMVIQRLEGDIFKTKQAAAKKRGAA
jgi:hypothetical protein